MDIEKRISQDQGYNAIGVVAKIEECGKIYRGVLVTPIYKYITFDTGAGNKPFVARFKGKAAMFEEFIQDTGGKETFLDMSKLEKGDIVVSPNLLYTKIPWSTKLRREHTIALSKYKPKNIIIADAPDPDEDYIQLDALNLAEDSTTKSAVHTHLKTMH